MSSSIKNTLYYKYLVERNECDVLENEHGFIVYKITNKECFIVDMFIDKEKRKKYYGTDLLNSLVDLAVENGCINVTANIHLWDKNCNSTLIAAINSGFRMARAENNILLVEKILEA